MSRVPGSFAQPRARVWQGPIPGTHELGYVEQPILERDVADELRRAGIDLELHAFSMGACNILLGREPAAGGPLRWHLTISCPDRHPTWDEIKTARYRLCGPDLVMAMILPPAAAYVNVAAQDHVFQLWELLADEEAWS